MQAAVLTHAISAVSVPTLQASLYACFARILLKADTTGPSALLKCTVLLSSIVSQDAHDDLLGGQLLEGNVLLLMVAVAL